MCEELVLFGVKRGDFSALREEFEAFVVVVEDIAGIDTKNFKDLFAVGVDFDGMFEVGYASESYFGDLRAQGAQFLQVRHLFLEFSPVAFVQLGGKAHQLL